MLLKDASLNTGGDGHFYFSGDFAEPKLSLKWAVEFVGGEGDIPGAFEPQVTFYHEPSDPYAEDDDQFDDDLGLIIMKIEGWSGQSMDQNEVLVFFENFANFL